MAKLTPEQKLINQAAAKRRDKAYNLRKNAYRAALDAIKQCHQAGPEQQAALEADRARDAAINAHRAAKAALEAQIAELTREIKRLDADFEPVGEALQQTRQAAWSAAAAALRKAEKPLESEYADVASCWSAAGWKSFEEFLPEKDAPAP